MAPQTPPGKPNPQPAKQLEKPATVSVPPTHSVSVEPEDGRRGFFKKALAVVAGAVATLIPLAAGFAFLLDPIRGRRFVPLDRPKAGGGGADDGFVRVTTLDALPADGRPQRFTVIADQSDAWNFFPNQRIGNVFLRKIGPDQVLAFNEICPHLGCSVEYNPTAPPDLAFRCPCHASAFSLDGQKSNAIPPRNLDSLEFEVRNGNEVWIRYQKFRIGEPEKIPVT